MNQPLKHMHKDNFSVSLSVRMRHVGGLQVRLGSGCHVVAPKPISVMRIFYRYCTVLVRTVSCTEHLRLVLLDFSEGEAYC
jgi:hypothetical protein